MSSVPRVILLDSNAYFRLARSIQPLLLQRFGGPPPYALKVLEDSDQEFSRSIRLQSKFYWVADSEFSLDRKKSQYSVRGKIASQVKNAITYLIHQAASSCIDLSLVDLRVLAVGYARSFPVVTDDRGMQEIAGSFGIECWSTMKLLMLMLDCERISMEKIHEIVEYWHAENDLPSPLRVFQQIYKELFTEDCPVRQ